MSAMSAISDVYMAEAGAEISAAVKEGVPYAFLTFLNPDSAHETDWTFALDRDQIETLIGVVEAHGESIRHGRGGEAKRFAAECLHVFGDIYRITSADIAPLVEFLRDVKAAL